jgi:hypothetical protein
MFTPGFSPMNITKHLLEGVKVLALFGAVALVVWSMPESGAHQAKMPDSGDWPSIAHSR